MNILITGGAGYIGSATAYLLLKKKITPIIIDKLIYKKNQICNCGYGKGYSIKEVAEIFKKKNFKNFSYSFKKKSYAIVGNNGSGKSTLLKIIGNLLLPTKGDINYDFKGENKGIDQLFFCAPYQEIITELTLNEFLIFHSKFRKLELDINELLDEFKLYKYRNIKIQNLSSGTIQKIKLMITFFSKSKFILLDEPTSNLDQESKVIYSRIMNRISDKKGIIIATNDRNDIVINNTEIIKIT